MKINNKIVKAAIFDLDGTILDSTNVWHLVDEMFFHRRKMEIPPTFAKEIAHIGLHEAAILTKKKYCPSDEIEDILKEWNQSVESFYLDTIQLKPHLKEYLDYLKANGVVLGIATANSSHLYLPCLKRNGIDSYFTIIADIDQVKCNKKDSKIYDYVADMLHATKEETVVFEDLPIALKTVKEKGYITVGVYDKASESKQAQSYCDVFITDFMQMMQEEN